MKDNDMSILTSAALAPFYQRNPDVDVHTYDFNDRHAIDALDWSGTDQASMLTALRAQQRMLHLNTNGKIADVLIGAGFDSAHAITGMSKDAFVDTVAPHLDGLQDGQSGAALAADIYRRAIAVRHRVSRLAANVMPDPANGARPFKRIDFQPDLPTYRELFGDITDRTCETGRSVLSPAAYFTDLMGLIECRITQPSLKHKKLPPGASLPERRPDLWQMPLDAESTYVEVPYLQVANAAMAKKLELDLGEDLADCLLKAVYPLTLPVNLPLEQVRAYLAHSDTKLVDIFRAFSSAPNGKIDEDILNGEGIELSPEMAKTITESDQELSKYVEKAYGLYTPEAAQEAKKTQEKIAELSLQSVFMKKTGLSGSELNDLIYQGTRQQAVSCLSFPHKSSATNEKLSDKELSAAGTFEIWLKLPVPDLSQKVKTTPQQWVSEEIHIALGNKVKPLWSHIALTWKKKDKTTWTWELYVNGAVEKRAETDKTTPNVQDLLNAAVTLGIHGSAQVRVWSIARPQRNIQADLHRRLTGTEPDLVGYWPFERVVDSTTADHSHNNFTLQLTHGVTPRLAPELVLEEHERIPALLHNLFINQALPTGHFITLIPASADGTEPAKIQVTDGTTRTPPTHLDLPTLDRLQKFIRLAKHLGWSFADLDWVLRCLTNSDAPGIATSLWSGLSALKTLQQESKLPLDVLCSLFADMKTIGIGSQGISHTLFDRVFNQPSAFYNPTGFQTPPPYHPVYAGNPMYLGNPFYGDGTDKGDNTLYWNTTNLTQQDHQLLTSLQSALHLSDVDLTTLLTHPLVTKQLKENNGRVGLTVKNLTVLFRFATLCRMTGLSMRPFLKFLGLIEQSTEQPTQKLTTPGLLQKATHVIANAAWLNTSGLSVEQLQYLMKRSTPPPLHATLPSEQVLSSALSRLAASAKSVLISAESLAHTGLSPSQVTDVIAALHTSKMIDTAYMVSVEGTVTSTQIASALQDLHPALSSLEVQSITDIVKTAAAHSTPITVESLAHTGLSPSQVTDVIAALHTSKMIDTAYMVSVEGTVTSTQIASALQDLHPALSSLEVQSITDIINAHNVHTQWLTLRNLVGHALAGPYDTTADMMNAVLELVRSQYAGAPQTNPPHLQIVYILLQVISRPESAAAKKFLAIVTRDVALAHWLSITAKEMSELVPQLLFPTTNPTVFSLSLIKEIVTFHALVALFQDTTNQLLMYLTTPNSTKEDLATIAHWDPVELDRLTKATGWTLPADSKRTDATSAKTRLAHVDHLSRCFTLAATVGISTDVLREIGKIGEHTDQQNVLWAAAALEHAVTAGSGGSDPTTVLAKIHGPVEQRRRDVLSSLLMWELGKRFKDINTLRDLSEFLLIDVQMSQAVSISPLKQGLDALQLYVHRCRNHLEPGITNTIPSEWWAWMGSYRLWQANREVYLYPENYVDPTLRKNQTPLFKALTHQLAQEEKTPENVRKAYATYLEGLAEIANLKIIDSYCHDLKDVPGGSRLQEKRLYLIGRLQSNPGTYYARSALFIFDSEPSQVTDVIAALHTSKMIDTAYMVSVEGMVTSTQIASALQDIHPALSSLEVQSITDIVKTAAAHSTPITVESLAHTGLSGQRILKDASISWTPWEEIPLTIHSDYVTPIFAFEKLFIFWVEQTTQTKQGKGGDNSKIHVTTATIHYAYQKVAGGWTHPHTLASDIIIRVANDEYKTEVPLVIYLQGWDSTSDYEKSEAWNKVQATVVTSTEADSPDSKVIRILLGDWVSRSSQPLSSKALPGTTPEETTFAEMLRLASEQAEKINPDYTTIVPGMTLTEGLLVEKQVEALGSHLPARTSQTQFPLQPVCSWSMTDHTDRMGHCQLSPGGTTDTKQTIDNWHEKESHFLGFNGRYDFYVIQNGSSYLEFRDQLMIRVWVHPKRGDSTQLSILGVTTSSLTQQHKYALYLQGKRDTPSLAVVGNVMGHEFIAGDIPYDQWSHIAFYWSGPRGRVKIYIHGKISLDSISNVPKKIEGWGGTFTGWIGARPGLGGYFSGVMGDLTVSDTLDSDWSFVNASAGSLLFPPPPVSLSPLPPWRVQTIRLSTAVPEALRQKFLSGGLKAMLTLDSQYLAEPSFDQYGLQDILQDILITNPGTGLLDFSGSYGVYFWELFFQIPFFIANTLNAHGQFKEAMHWYEYIFNPTQAGEGVPSGMKPLYHWPLEGTFRDDPGNHSSPKWVDTIFADNLPRKVLLLQTGLSFPTTSIRAPITFEKATAITIEMWVKPVDLVALHGTLFAFQVTTGGHFSKGNKYVLGFTRKDLKNYHVYAELHMDKESSPINTEKHLIQIQCPYPSDNRWHHLAVTWSATSKTVRLYVDGREQAQKPARTPFENKMPPGQAIYIGNDLPSASPFIYEAADVSLWDVERTPAEVYLDSLRALRVPFWRFAPFRGHILETMQEILTHEPAQIAASEYDPFDPDAIAHLRIGAYEKGLVMKYLDNLIQYGDALFTQDSWETISEATMYYTLAADILGQPPKTLPARATRALTYQELENQRHTDPAHAFRMALEPKVPSHPTHSTDISAAKGADKNWLSLISRYFCVPGNMQLAHYWDVVANRLYNIHHGLNIKGQAIQPPLFEPPINPEVAIQAAASGGTLALPPTSHPVPPYRFRVLIERTKSVAAEVATLGSALLTALEKGDAEHLARMRTQQETQLLTLGTQLQHEHIQQVQATRQSLQAALANAQLEQRTYHQWITKGLSPDERSGVALMAEALDFQIGTTALSTAATIGYLIPTVFGLSDGAFDPGGAINAAAQVLQAEATISGQRSQLAMTRGQFSRRNEDWQLQLQRAENTITQVTAELAANELALKSAQQELAIHQTQIHQAQAITQFLHTKFTNHELYQWLAGQLASLYFRTYQLAREMASQAQTAYQYELDSTQTFLANSVWHADHRGLNAGEELVFSLNQMEQSYLQHHHRRLEIEKTISLLQHDPQELINFKKSGSCTFHLTETDFALDFPGHYCRKIKTISVSIPAVVGPYQNVHATLTQLSNQVLMYPDIDAVKHLMGLQETAPPNGSIRRGWNADQQVALSTGLNDEGLFELNFQDERYLPFEETGAISTWQLDMPKPANPIDFQTITDVIITLRYTAKDGGSSYARQVTQLPPLQTYEGTKYISLRQFSPNQWQTFLQALERQDAEHTLTIDIKASLFQINISDIKMGHKPGSKQYEKATPYAVIARDVHLANNQPSLSLKKLSTSGTPIEEYDAPIGKWELTASNIPQDVRLSGNIIDPSKWLLDVIMLIPFSGDLWPKEDHQA
jgi:uncharacterized membrane protein